MFYKQLFFLFVYLNTNVPAAILHCYYVVCPVDGRIGIHSDGGTSRKGHQIIAVPTER